MTPEAVTLATMALAMGAYGRSAGRSEAQDIRDRINAGIDEDLDLDHGALLRERIAIGTIITQVLSLAYAWFLNLDGRVAVPTILAHALRVASLGWASFTILHRLSLNSARKLPWWYCAPGNVYDRAWLVLAIWMECLLAGEVDRYTKKDARYLVKHHNRVWGAREPVRIACEDRPTIVVTPKYYRRAVKAAGVAMFAFEVLVAAVTITSLWW